MIQNKRDYSEEIANICKQHHVKYLGLHGSGRTQESPSSEDSDIGFLVEFDPLELEQYAKCYFGLEEELEDLFGRHVGLVDIGKITHPDILRQLTKNKTDIYGICPTK
jgi:predicted nucleotidyltransferase